MEERIKIYLGDAYTKTFTVKMNQLTGIQKPYSYCYNEYRGKKFPLNNTTYFHDLTRFIFPYPQLYDSTFLFYPHDRVEPFKVPTLVKSRPISEGGYSILLNMNYMRHFKEVFLVEKNDMLFNKKKDVLIWRGGCTGYGFGNNIPYRPVSRQTLVEHYSSSKNPTIDIGLAGYDKKRYNQFEMYEKPSMTLSEQLTNKFILSVEGNDVATNLKWILQSNSVPVCPPFSLQSWILEDKLIPYQHYLPIRADFSDLEEKIDWAIHHPSVCRDMIKNGKEYMSSFWDIEQEEKIRKEILFHYSKNVRCII